MVYLPGSLIVLLDERGGTLP